MKRMITKLFIFLILLLIAGGCTSNPIDISGIDSTNRAPEEIKAEGNPFVIYEHEGKNIPVLADALPMNRDYYLKKQLWRIDTDHAELIPTSYMILGNARSTLYSENGDHSKREDVAMYVDVSTDGKDLDVKFEGYIKNNGKLFIEGWTKVEHFIKDENAEDYRREQLQTAYNLVGDVAYAQKGWSYYDGEHVQSFGESFCIDAKSKELTEKNIFNDNSDIYSYDNDLGMPEYRFEVTKDRKEIIDDLSNMYCLWTSDHFREEDYLISEYMNEELWKVFDMPYMEDSLSIYVHPEIAYLRDYELTTREDNEGHTYEGIFEKDDERYFFDGDWKLVKYENSEIKTEYTYEDGHIDIKLTDLVSGNSETLKYEVQ